MAIEFGCRNTNQIIGYGIADYEQPSQVMARCKITQSASNTNTVRTTKWSSSEKAKMPVGSNITICDTAQTTILTQALLTNVSDGTDYTDWTFDGNPVTVTTDCFIGSAPLDTNFTEDCSSGALSWHTGRANWVASSTTQNPVRYRWIENIIGNVWHILPDITFHNLQMFVCKNMKDYEMFKHTDAYAPESALFTQNNDNGSKLDVSGYNYWITALEHNPFIKGVDFGRSYDKNLLSTKAFGAYYYLYNGTNIIANGGGFDHLYRCNMLTQRAWVAANNQWFLYGARLMYKHLI